MSSKRSSKQIQLDEHCGTQAKDHNNERAFQNHYYGPFLEGHKNPWEEFCDVQSIQKDPQHGETWNGPKLHKIVKNMEILQDTIAFYQLDLINQIILSEKLGLRLKGENYLGQWSIQMLTTCE